jgi:putative membrane protein
MSRTLTCIATAAIALIAAPSAAHAATHSELDGYLLRSSMQGDRFEIAGGKLAQSKASTPAVRALGARLVKDHTKSLKEAETVARRLGVPVPGTPSPTEEWELATVGAMSGTAFDAAYARLEVQDHKQDIEDTKDEIRHGLNADVRHLAASDLPVLRTHLKLAKEALAAV